MITEKYIMKRVSEWASTDAGKAAIKAKYGIDYDEKADAALRKYAEMMKNILYKHTHDLIKSISRDDIEIGELHTNDDGKAEIKISFKEGSLQRESLRPDKYPDGVENIVLLFAHGYDAGAAVKGVWVGSKSYPHVITSKQHREPNDFLQDAISEFNAKSGGIAQAVLEDRYK
jgi:hypothetical protein